MAATKRKRLPRITLAQRRKRIAANLRELVMSSRVSERRPIVETIVDAGLRIMGDVDGMDTENAIVVFPDDGTLSVMLAITEHAEKTGLDVDEICERLVQRLQEEPIASLN